MKAIALVLLVAASPAPDPVEIYKAHSFVWDFQSTFVEQDEKYHEYCKLADEYDSIEVNIRRTVRDRHIYDGHEKKDYKFTADEAKRLEDFADDIAFKKRSAERRCKR